MPFGQCRTGNLEPRGRCETRLAEAPWGELTRQSESGPSWEFASQTDGNIRPRRNLIPSKAKGWFSALAFRPERRASEHRTRVAFRHKKHRPRSDQGR